jgi:tetratricopeptide (TPR) repeat protein
MTNWDELYDHIINHAPSPGTIFVLLSKLKETGDRKRVIQECIRALASCPDDIPIRRLLAETYFEMGLLSQAEAEIEKVVTRLDDLVSAYKLQASTYHNQKRDQEAANALKIYLAHRPDDEDAFHLLGMLEIGKKRLAPEPIVVEQGPLQPQITMDKGPHPVEKTTAEESPISEAEAFPEIATPALAEIYFNQGQIPEAIHTYEMVVAKNPDDERSMQRMKELKALEPAEPVMAAKKVDKEREITERMITILEGWLAGIRKIESGDTILNSFHQASK